MPGTASSASDAIRVVGAREHNLRDVHVEIPKRRLTVFTGVSGSGKSSLVFATIAAESQRLINETYSAFVQGFMPHLPRPDVDLLEGLTPAIVVDQQRLGADPRSTVGTATDANALLRVLFSRLAEPRLGGPNAYSFNVASVAGSGSLAVGGKAATRRTFSRIGGMCPRCEGRGEVSDLDLAQIVDESKSLADGAIVVPGYTGGGWTSRMYLESGLFDPTVPVARFTERQRHDLLFKEPTRMKIAGINMTYEGIVVRVRRTILSRDVDGLQPHLRAFVERAATFGTCPECHGTRLAEATRASTIGGTSIADACAMQVSDLAAWVRSIADPGVGPLVASLASTLESFVEIGLGYLSLDRPSGTLSGGEAQRVKMVGHLGSALTDITYVFDEPTTGLHAHDVARMNELLLRLRDKGTTVLVIEHEPATIAIADHVIDLGPGAGSAGGAVCFEGDVAGLRTSGTLTGRHLADAPRLKPAVRQPTGHMAVRAASVHNLRAVDVDIPLGVLVAVTGVAGSGKTSLVSALPAGVTTVDQTPIHASRRSSPATFTGVLEPIRKAFAKANGVKPALFSANSEGACPACSGVGVVFTDLALMGAVPITCDECEGRRYDRSVLALTLRGRSIADVLELSVDEARSFFVEPPVQVVLGRLADVGLGYLTLGRPLTTLSGGERQRLKLATHLGGGAATVVLDEPTTGLHMADVDALLALLDRLVDAGSSLLVVEHDLAVIAHADWVIDLGPGAGHDGGRVVFAGTPMELAGAATATGEALAARLAG